MKPIPLAGYRLVQTSFPREVRAVHQLELTSRCNLRCAYCLDVDQLVPTEFGPVSAKNIQPGVVVFGSDGTRRTVTEVHPHYEEMVTIKPVNIPSIKVSASHLVHTKRGMVPAGTVDEGDVLWVPELRLGGPRSLIDMTRWDNEFKYMRTSCNESVLVTPDVAWLIGLYVAEGCVGRHGPTDGRKALVNTVQITLHKDEIEILDRAQRVLECAFGVKVKRYHQHSVTRLVVQNVRAAAFFAYVIGKTGEEKRIPFELIGGDGLAGPFLHGLFQGDAHRGVHNGSLLWSFYTAYDQIRDGVVSLLINLGILPSVCTESEPRSGHFIGDREVVSVRCGSQVRVVGVNAHALERSFVCTEAPPVRGSGRGYERGVGGFWVNVKSVESSALLQQVIGVEVDGDHTFVAGHVSTHNCTSPAITRGDYPDRTAQDMSAATFARALEWVRYYVRAGTQSDLNLAGIGESTLHPMLVPMLRRVREVVGPKVKLTLATNGIVVEDEITAAFKEHQVAVWVSLHRPERASKAVHAYREAGVLEGVSYDPSTNANDWAGQVEWHNSPGNDIPCQWLRQGKVFVMSDGRISTCCLDASGKGVVGHVDQEVGSVRSRPWEACMTCYQVIAVEGYDQRSAQWAPR